jgi:DNA-binding transcriptional LysR family regulator
MDARQLEAFIAVVEIGSFTRAAARLDLSQPTVTTRIKSLEQRLGTTLLERLPRGVKPTDAGLELIPYARQIVGLTARARQAVASGGQPHGRVEVGSVESLTNHRLLPLVEYLYRRYPDVQISMHAPRNGDAVSMIRSGELDCAFLVDARQDHDDLETRVLCPEPLVLVAGQHHELLGRCGITADDLRGRTLVRSDGYADYQSRFERAIGLAGANQSPRLLELDSLAAAKLSVANGIGMALMPRVAVARELSDGRLRRIDWSPPFVTVTQLVWRRGTMSRAAFALLAAAEQVVHEQEREDR